MDIWPQLSQPWSRTEMVALLEDLAEGDWSVSGDGFVRFFLDDYLTKSPFHLVGIIIYPEEAERLSEFALVLEKCLLTEDVEMIEEVSSGARALLGSLRPSGTSIP